MGAGKEPRPVGQITVKVVNARNLKNQELLSKSDPYCKVTFVAELPTTVACRQAFVCTFHQLK